MQSLPKWALINPLPVIYDFESVTPLQQTARVYGAMNEMIKEYNSFVDQLNKEIESFTGSSESEIANFKKSIEQRLICKFNDLDAAFAKMKVEITHHADDKIGEIYDQYLNNVVSQRTYEIINEKISTGDIQITLVYDPETEELTMAAGEV